MTKDNSSTKIGQNVYLEEIKLTYKKPESYEMIWDDISKAVPDGDEYKFIQDKIKTDLGIVDNEVFRDIASLTTEVTARIAIDPKTGTVKPGALWYEEALPTDTFMYSLILLPKRHKTGSDPDYIANRFLGFNGKVLNVGGDETIGRGFVRTKVVSNAKNT